jgi:WD40 repeat protein/pimeloyl-ACP methyl ester carboxylesterase
MDPTLPDDVLPPAVGRRGSHVNAGHDGHPPSPAERRKTSATTASSKPGFFSRVTTFRKASDSGLEDIKGPLGLTTLHKPLGSVVADIIFVHGLGGGSRKTWSKNENPELFWPAEWLPNDQDFRNVRIHTFGYDSNYDKSSILNVHDFAKSLLEWVTNSPDIPRDSRAPLILVCHSMGGLVAKKAFILSKQLSEYEKFSTVVRSIFFLATPHRGSNLADILDKILQVSPGARPFVNDLQPNSVMLEAINEEFPHYCRDLHLFSFYETLPMNFGIKKGLVVPKDSATLGYENERRMYLDADHRGVCKFESRDSPNYRAVRNALADAFNHVKLTLGIPKKTTDIEQLHIMNDSLDISDSPEDDFLRVDALRLPGSCAWIVDRSAFQSWKADGYPQLYWITAKPGAGKSVCCSYVLNELRQANYNCAFYFFVHGDKVKSSMGKFFRSIAWQMASTDLKIMESLGRVCKKNPQLFQEDYRTIWRKLFLECIFKCPTDQPQFWVIDALDECKTDSELVPYLLQAAATGFVRIILTSRTTFDSYGLPISSRITIHTDAVSESTTESDIELYLRANINNLPGRDRQHTLRLLLEKSSGCFLWVRLALQELRHVSTKTGIERILEATPSDMDQLYNRILDTIFSRAREQKMVLAVLDWTACASRPLTTNELYEALRIDLQDDIDDNLTRFINNNCGELVIIDPQNNVRMIHLTARDFLFSPKNVSTIRLDRRVGHKRLATVCLRYLTGPEMAGPKPRKLSASHMVTERKVFAAYACNAWFEHLSHVSSDDDEFAEALLRFAKSPNILSWVEYTARDSNLGRLIQAGQALRTYVQRRKKNTIPFGNIVKHNELLDSWAIDLIRLVTKFGVNLKSSPTSIHNLIPPFCPERSALRQQFGSSNRSIKVGGLPLPTWDDCTSTITLPESTTALATGPSMFAIGMQNGAIAIYDEIVYQELRTINHGEPVKKLLFGEKESLLISAGLKQIKVWNVATGELYWTFDVPAPFISLALADEDRLLLASVRTNELIIYDLHAGYDRAPTSWLSEDEEEHSSHFRRPVTTAISGDQTLLAVAYRGQDIFVYDIENECTYDVYGKDEGSLGAQAEKRKGIASAISLIFSKATETKLLVVGYNDGVLNLFNMAEGTLQARAPANAHVLASSANGLTLAAGNSGGTIHIFEFDTLRTLYRIQAEEMNIKQLAFSLDNHRLLDIQGRHCRIWDPPVLVRQQLDDEESDTISVSTAPQDFSLQESITTTIITALSHDNGGIAFYGKDNGCIYLFDIQSGKELKELLRHTLHIPIVQLQFDVPSSTLVSTDSSGRTMAHKLFRSRDGWSVGSQSLDHRTDSAVAVNQMLVNVGCTRILLATSQFDALLSIGTESGELERVMWPNRQHYRWSLHPQEREQIVLLMEGRAHIYNWDSLARLSDEVGILLESTALPEMSVRAIHPCFDSQYLATVFSESHNARSRSKLMIWDANSISPGAMSIAAVPHFQPLADHVQYLIGTYGHRVVFLHLDGWVCSADSHSFDDEYYDRHFFIPADWLSTTGLLRMDIVKNGTILFVKADSLITIRRGMEFFEHGQSRGLAKRPALARSVASDPTDAGHNSVFEHSRNLSNATNRSNLSIRWKNRQDA